MRLRRGEWLTCCCCCCCRRRRRCVVDEMLLLVIVVVSAAAVALAWWSQSETHTAKAVARWVGSGRSIDEMRART
jgi:hypothetical protein